MAFEAAPLLIGLREGLEALLVLGIVLGMLDRLQARDRRGWVWLGFGAGVAASVLLGLLVQRLLGDRFEDRGALVFELAIALAAVAVLTYMVLWMQHHARHMVSGLKAKVETAVTNRQVWVLAGLGFVTVLREGLEVVLFFSALAERASWSDLALWGMVGFAISGVLAYAIFAMTVKVDLRRFFAVTGLLLIFIAAGLLMHVAHAAMELGWIGHGAPLWDTSSVLPDEDHWLGGPLHAFIGYEDQPTLLQLLLYTGYLVGVGGWYLSGLRERDAARARTATAAVLVVLLFAFAIAGAVAGPTLHDEDAVGHDGHASLYGVDLPAHLDHKAITQDAVAALAASGQTVGVLVRSHGEPIHYNASTYVSFKEFVRDIWPYTGLPDELLSVDKGTYYLDAAHPFSQDVHHDARLVDAWLAPGELPAVPVDDGDGGVTDALAGGPLWLKPGPGPGLGEPDVFEMAGLGAYRTWLKMDNHSPKVEQTEDHFLWMEQHLFNHFGEQVVVAFAHHIDPKVGAHRTLDGAVKKLVDADVDVILDSYHSSVFSDAMNTCMMQHHAHDAIAAAGFTGKIVPVGMAGTHAAWGEAVAAYVAAKMDHFHPNETVSIHLAQHGGRPGGPNPCGPQGSVDQYHANLDEEFQVTKEVLERHFGDRFTLRHVYGQGAEERGDGELSPMEALELDRRDGIGHAVVIPYEFWSDSMDNLVPLRENLGFTADQAPYYDAQHETHTTINGVHVDVWSAHYGVHEKGTAHLARISEAMVAALR